MPNVLVPAVYTNYDWFAFQEVECLTGSIHNLHVCSKNRWGCLAACA